MWCSEAWDVNSIYDYLGVNLLKIIWEPNTALLWLQGLSSACRSGSWLQRCLKQTKRWSWAQWQGCKGFTKPSMGLGAISSYKWSFLECGKQLCPSTDNHSRKAHNKTFKHFWPDEELHCLQWSWLQFCLLKSKLTWGGKDEEDSKKEALFVTHLYSVLVPARTGLVFAVVRRRHVQDTEVILHHLAFARGGGKGVSFGDKGSQHSTAGPVQGSTRNGWIWSIVRGFVRGNDSFLVPSITNIVVVNVHFLTSLLFLVNFSYLMAGSLPFVPPILLSLPLQEGEGGNEGHMISVGALNCGVPFLNMTYSTWLRAWGTVAPCSPGITLLIIKC